jgi:hypothetical protein
MSMLSSENGRNAIKYSELEPTLLFSKREGLAKPVIKLINYVKLVSTEREAGKLQQK